MKQVRLVKFELGIGDFVTDKEVTPELVKDYIEKEAPGVYPNLRVQPYSDGSGLCVAYDGEYIESIDTIPTKEIYYISIPYNFF